MAPAHDGSPPLLPTDVARNILGRLSSKDLCSAIAACRSFYSWGIACTCVDAMLPSQQEAFSLLDFLHKRFYSGLDVSSQTDAAS